MRYVSAYLLALLGGNKSPSAADISRILGSVGIEVDNEKVAKVVSELSGKNIQEVIESGSQKLASMPSGGAAPVAGGAAPAAAAESAQEAKKEEKKEESEEEDDDMGFGLFD